ncbi:hypothetical protein M2132_000223 [Dysgonomonas sp. PH5-45]|uniref:hypothetical protein n=1 Tax=unclassified Dysgonomonas TaxID=2630389 RepID=UPI002476C78A|nr:MULTISPECIES: hypothetical protein [unclassified Dysgonomonas]MDH6353903.1 hypothetical protein [Dysgonomonas sp. PH5-45]MDH6386805.1 hypothetical protein [Dysgonomonas sp. PH5-37]
MAKVYDITSQEKRTTDCSFDLNVEATKKEEKETASSAYGEILKIFKEAFSLIDVTKIIKGR